MKKSNFFRSSLIVVNPRVANKVHKNKKEKFYPPQICKEENLKKNYDEEKPTRDSIITNCIDKYDTENLECDCSAAERDYEDSFIVCMKKFQCEEEE